MSLRRLSLSCVLGFFPPLSVVLWASPEMPGPVGESWSVPAGVLHAELPVPRLVGTPDAKAPQIGQMSELTYPDETMVVAGEGLEGSRLRVWNEGRIFTIDPLRADNQRLQAIFPVAVEGVPLKPSVLVVWPEREGLLGAPARVNAPTVWWTFPARPNPGEEVRVFGKNLSLAEGGRVALIDTTSGRAVALAVGAADPYEVKVRLPANLSPGPYSLQVHNGTGGGLGWSLSHTLEIVASIPEPTKVIKIPETGFNPYEGFTPLLRKAIDEAVAAGGAIIELPRGYFELRGTPIILPEGVPIILRGVGPGILRSENQPGWWFKLRRVEDGGSPATALGTQRGSTHTGDPSLFIVKGDGSRIENLFLMHNAVAAKRAVVLQGRRQTLRNVRMVSASPYLWDARLLDVQNVREADITIEGCEFTQVAASIEINNAGGVRIADCSFLGNYGMGRGVEANAIRPANVSGVIIEGSKFRGIDREEGRTLGRAALFSDNNCRNIYIRHNELLNVGTSDAVMATDGNVGEQFLFHTFHEVGRDFAVREADATSLWPEVAALKAVKEEFFTDENVAVFVSEGRGAGQLRVVARREADGRLFLTRPWRIVPDAGSRVTIDRRFRQIAILDNYVNPDPEQRLRPWLEKLTFKTLGVLYYYNTFDTITAGNTFENTSSGVNIMDKVGTSNGWNVVRDNTMRGMYGFPGGTTFAPVFLSHTERETPQDMARLRGWLSVGNSFVSNRGIASAGPAGYQGWMWYDARPIPPGFVPGDTKGMMMTVFENNAFQGSTRGFLFSAPANWTLFRNNTVEISDRSLPETENLESSPALNLLLLPP